jgi:hypothetical protein
LVGLIVFPLRAASIVMSMEVVGVGPKTNEDSAEAADGWSSMS